MALVDVDQMTRLETIEYIEYLEDEIKLLRKKTDNRKKLTDVEVNLIHRLYSEGKSQAEIADIFAVNAATISRTVRGIYHK